MTVVAGPAGPLEVGISGSSPVDGEAVLLLHPANLRGAAWAAVSAHLEPRMACVAPDLRGHGGSHRSADGAYGVDAWADDCAAVLDALGLDRVHAVGASAGAAVAVELAARRPRAVATVIAVGGAFLPAPDAARDLLEAIDALGPAAALRRHAAEDALAPGSAPALAEAVADDLSDNDAATVAAIWTAALATDVRPRLPDVVAPCLAVVGELDRTCPPEESRWFAEATGARLERLPGVGHLPMYEAPSALAGLIREHTSSTTTRSTMTRSPIA